MASGKKTKRLDSIKKAHGQKNPFTTRMEDYLEVISDHVLFLLNQVSLFFFQMSYITHIDRKLTSILSLYVFPSVNYAQRVNV